MSEEGDVKSRNIKQQSRERGYMIKALNLEDGRCWFVESSENTRHREMVLKNIFQDYYAWPEVFLFVPLACTLKSAHQTA